ncbi:MAG: glycine cleavage system aminomethyltransferase GcvT [Bacillota bacterium]
MMEARQTPLYEQHMRLNGSIVNYSGWLLPVQFAGIVSEVNRARQKAVLFDVSHMGEVTVEGAGAEAYLQKIVTNDLSLLKDGAVIYSPLCYPDGGTVDDILIYRYNWDRFLLVVNAANTEKDYAWLMRHARNGESVALHNISVETAQIALQGPASPAILSPLTAVPLGELKYHHFLPEVELAGIKCMVSRTGYTGEDGYEIYCAAAQAGILWDAVMSAGRERLGLGPAGLGARDVLRLEAGLPLYGHELSAALSPLMAGLDRFVSFKKQIPFIGREALLEQKRVGPGKKLVGLTVTGRGVIREGYPVLAGDAEIGWVSSGTYSPTFEKSLGMAFLTPEKAVAGEELLVMIRGRAHPVKVEKIPLYRRVKS